MCDSCSQAGPSRRSLLLGGAALATLPLVGRVARAQPVSAADTPDAALKLLTEGNERYVANQPRERDFSAGRASRGLGQAPFAAILGCADSRVAPELAFDQGPGDLFVVRLAGNFVTTEGLASLEFGAAVLGTKLIMVLGHSSCGAVNATVAALQKGNDLPGHIADLVRAMKPGIEEEMKKTGPDIEQRAVVANVRHNVKRLEQATPILAEMVANKKLRVVGAVYDLPTGKVALVQFRISEAFGPISLPHNGAVVTLLAVCGSTHRESYLDIVMVGIVSALIALVAVIALGSMFGSF